jgi:plasmid maintenance system antidote protein VapI
MHGMPVGPKELRDWMDRRGFNCEEAARNLGMHPSMLTKLANGTRNAGLKIALRIERKTGIPVEAWESDQSDKSDTPDVLEAANSLSDK